MDIDYLSSESLNIVKGLLAEYEFNDYRNYRIFKKKLIGEYLFSQIANSTLDNKEASVVVAKDGIRIVGLTSLIKLPRESGCFGFNMAKIGHIIAVGSYKETLRIKNALLSFILKLCKADGIRHLSCRIDTSDFSGIHILEANDFRIMDTMVTYIFNRFKHKIPYLRGFCKVRPFKKDDLDALLTLTQNRILHSRFYRDIHLSREGANKLYTETVKDYCRNLEDNRIFAAEGRSEIIGFIAYKRDRALEGFCGIKILGRGLSVVSPEVKGVYPALVRVSAEDVVSSSCDIGEYDTQLDNKEVIRVWQRFGLDYVRSRHTFHMWLPETKDND